MNDRKTVLLVVGLLGAVALFALGIIGYLAVKEIKPAAELTTALITALSGSIGAVAGILSTTRSSPPEPPPSA